MSSDDIRKLYNRALGELVARYHLTARDKVYMNALVKIAIMLPPSVRILAGEALIQHGMQELEPEGEVH